MSDLTDRLRRSAERLTDYAGAQGKVGWTKLFRLGDEPTRWAVQDCARAAGLALDLREAADLIERQAGWFPHACKIVPLCQCGQNWTCQICGESGGSCPCACTPLPGWNGMAVRP